MPVTPRSLRFGIVASRFNQQITERLVDGAVRFFQKCRVPKSRLEVVWVPGAFELPVTALTLARSGRYRAIVALGCILEGETPHYRYLSEATLQGLMMAGMLTGVPVTSGVITVKGWDLALKRSQKRGLNRGREAAECAWELAQTLKARR
jgi:6,7-dimethyl-8-ribityllumazine synthase